MSACITDRRLSWVRRLSAGALVFTFKMLTQKFRDLIEEHNRKKWFPDKYPDPFDEFIDYISEGMISDLQEGWRRAGERSLLSAAYYISNILPTVQFRDLFRLAQESMARPLGDQEIRPNVVFYHLRTLPDDESSKVWHELKEWTSQWQTALRDWLHAVLNFESSHSEIQQNYSQSIGLDSTAELSLLEKILLESRDLFKWQISNRSIDADFYRLVRHFRFEHSQNIADWKDIVSLAKVVAERCHIKRLPQMQQAIDPAVLYAFPVTPPLRVLLEYGNCYGVYDAMRALFEVGKSFFYAGMNPELPSEHRICGDPALSVFWGYLYSHLLADRYSLAEVVGLRAEPLAKDVRFAHEFSFRYDAALALYRSNASPSLEDSEDTYVKFMEVALPVEAPHFLHLYDLNRSNDALFRARAHRAAMAAVDRFEFLHGKYWYASQRLARRFREYWWEGYRLSLQDVLNDLDVTLPQEYPFYAQL